LAKFRLKPAIFIVTALAALCAHAVLNVAFPRGTDFISDAFYAFWTYAAFCVCLGRGVRSRSMRSGWLLLSTSLFLWFSATVVSAWGEFVQHASQKSATMADFFYFFYGVPILLAIAVPDDTRSNHLFFWLDGLQAAAAGFLAYLFLFGVLPFSGAPLRPISAEQMVWIYDIENLLLAALATGRLLVSKRGSGEWRFLRVLSSFLAVYGLFATVYNHIVIVYTIPLLDGMLDVPFVLLALTAATARATRVSHRDLRSRTTLALVIDNARPVLLGLVLVLLSVWVAQEHFAIAMVVVIGAFVVYGVRSTSLQNRLVRSQIALEDARDRLEELAMQDGLTRIANRRCFDQRFVLEWNRAHRTRLPLSLLLIDIDHFKRLNDTYGHIAGDECLVQMAATLRKVLNRPGDLLARYGGEEFVAMLPETDETGARNVALLLQAALRGTKPIPVIEKQITVSIGVSTCQRVGPFGPEHLVQAADRALYQAKQGGRNRVEYFGLDFWPRVEGEEMPA
jgi:diguanylate cyclase (GGDEF)-like protein